MAQFNYSAYYRRLQEIKKLQIPAEAVCWTEQYHPPDRAYDIVLYLGCNILRTPDVAADVVTVFRALGLDFIAVAGVQFCCGITWDRFGDVAKGQTVTDLTIERLASYKAGTVVHWCPSCDVHFSDVVTGRDAKTIPFDVTNAPAFLADLSQRGHIPWHHDVTGRVALHCHSGRDGHESGQRRAQADQAHVSQLLSQISGLQFLGAVTAPPEFDYDCGPSSIRVDRAQWLALRVNQLNAVRQTGADTLVTVSHACQREWCDASDASLTVRNYISLVAEAIGCTRSYESDSLGRLKHADNIDEIVASTQANWTSHGLSKEQAEDIAEKYSWETPAPRSSAP
ncbi:MAG: (Fe-S)-binding protein [Deltaproteobacteria bacterium]|nr:(Fe-S)-binding protein [Deltaproteobacteria bacterium]